MKDKMNKYLFRPILFYMVSIWRILDNWPYIYGEKLFRDFLDSVYVQAESMTEAHKVLNQCMVPYVIWTNMILKKIIDDY